MLAAGRIRMYARDRMNECRTRRCRSTAGELAIDVIAPGEEVRRHSGYRELITLDYLAR